MREAQVCTPVTEGTQGGAGDLPIIMQMAGGKSGFTPRQLGSRVHPLNHCHGQPPPRAALQWVSSMLQGQPRCYGSPWWGAQSGRAREGFLPGGVPGKTWSQSRQRRERMSRRSPRAWRQLGVSTPGSGVAGATSQETAPGDESRDLDQGSVVGELRSRRPCGQKTKT